MFYLMLAFNVFETILIFSVGYLIGMSFVDMLSITMLFAFPRMLFNGSCHYKSPIKCLFVSLFLIVSIFMTFNINSGLGYIVALFTGCLLTEKGNITNVYQFAYKKRNEPSKYQDLLDYITFYGITDKYLEAEELLKSRMNTKDFMIYKKVFIQRKTWNEVEEELDVNRQNISKALDQAFFNLVGRLGL